MKQKDTLRFLGLAAVSLVLAVAVFIIFGSGRTEIGDEAASGPIISEVGQPVCPELKTDTKIRSIEIKGYNPASQSVETFKLVRASQDGQSGDERWSIFIPNAPGSNEGKYYPADNSEAVGKIASAFVDLKYEKQVGTTSESHKTLGLIDPEKTGENLDPTLPRGKYVILLDEQGKKVVDVIIGNKDSVNESFAQIRQANSSHAYSAKLDPELFNIKFDAWINTDLLKVERDDVTSITIDPYFIGEQNVEVAPGFQSRGLGVQNMGNAFTISKSDGADWALTQGNAGGKTFQPAQASTVLNAIDQLKIMGARVNDFAKNPQGRQQVLQTDGFYMTNRGSLIGQRGEVTFTTKKGLTYRVLLGGTVAGSEKPATAGTPNPEEGQEENQEKRYVFVEVKYDPVADTSIQPDEPPKEGEEASAEPKPKGPSEGAKLFKELEERFANWYYIVSKADYEKLDKELKDFLKDN